MEALVKARIYIVIAIAAVSAAIVWLVFKGGLPAYDAVWPIVGAILIYGNFAERKGDNRKRAEIIVGEVYDLIDKSQFHAAKEHLKLAKALAPDYYGIYAARGEIYRNEREYDSAIKELRKAISLNSSSFKANFAMGLSCLQGKKILEAISAFKRAVKINPEHIETYFILAQSYELNGDKNSALESYQSYVNLAEKVQTYDKKERDKIKNSIEHSQARIRELQ